MFHWKGNKIEIGIWGTSHAPEIGVEMVNFPQEDFDVGQLQEFLSRRRASGGVFSTSRIEGDVPQFVCGVNGGKIVENKVQAIIPNTNVKSSDYNSLYGKPRPSHVDYAAYLKDGRLDFSGGGEFSGRMTAPFSVAGGIAKQMLEKRGIKIFAYVSRVGKVCGASYKTQSVSALLKREEVFPSLSCGQAMLDEIASARSCGDSVGGVAECVVEGLQGGVGGALFDGLEGKIASLIYAIPAVKGVEFGDGFALSQMRGSVANDALHITDGKIVAKTNHAGGINGGISNGMPITLSVAFRPTPSISQKQSTVDLVSGQNVEIEICGRHDACIVPRALPVVESAVAIALLDVII